MQVKWLMQSNAIHFTHYTELFLELKRQNIEVQEFGVLSPLNLTNLENILEPNKTFITRGGTRILNILNDINHISECNEFLTQEQNNNSDYYIKKLKESIDYSFEKFDQLYYKDLNIPLLNSTASYLHFRDCKDLKFKEDMFIKPSRDLKSFNGGIIQKGTTIEEYILSGQYQNYYKDEVIIISDLKEIYSEYRFFCLKDQIITGSIYRMGNKSFVSNIIPQYILDAAKEYVKLYQPADVFVMDLADVKNDVKIVEYNCWNCSGFYNSDISKLINVVTEFKGK